MYKVRTTTNEEIVHVGNMGSCIDYCFKNYGALLTFLDRGECISVFDEMPELWTKAVCVIEPHEAV